MTLKINAQYAVGQSGYLIPRSKFSGDKPSNQYAVIELLEVDGTHFLKRSTTMSKRELRKMLGISNREGVEIV